MTTIRVARRHRFTSVDRRAVNDERLSFRARGLLVWLLDKPDDWVTSVDRLASQSPEGKYAVTAACRELEACGYLKRRKYREGGKWATEWVINEVPPDAETAHGEEAHRTRKPRTAPDAVSAECTEPPLRATEITETENPLPVVAHAPPAKGKVDPTAHELAVTRWELHEAKPVCGFVALRARIGEALESGHSREEVARVLPAMSVFSRNAFDFALRSSPAPTREGSWTVEDRTVAGGRIVSAAEEDW